MCLSMVFHNFWKKGRGLTGLTGLTGVDMCILRQRWQLRISWGCEATNVVFLEKWWWLGEVEET